MANQILDIQFPEENPRAAPAPDFAIHAGPESFGGFQAHALGSVGQGAEKLGETGLDVATARQHLQNEVHASELNTWLADRITDRHAAFATLEGRAAMDALPQYKKDIEGLYQQSLENGGGSLDERTMLARTGRQLTTRYYGYGVQHADGQFRKWMDDTAVRRAASFGQQAGVAASAGDDAGMTTFLNTSDDEVKKLYEQKRYDAEATADAVRKNRGRNLKQIIESKIDESPAAASAMYRKYESQMDAASSLEVRNKLRTALSQIEGHTIADEETGRVAPAAQGDVAGVPGGFLSAIKRSEGFRPNAYWDVRQHTIGYGTRATGPNETITREEADRRFNTEITRAADIVDRVNPNLDPGTRAALTSLTFNAGDAWTRSGLGDKVRAGDLAGAKTAFLQYANAGGAPNAGLAERRYREAAWFGQNAAPAGTQLTDRAEAFDRIIARTQDNPLIQSAALARMNQIYAVDRQQHTQTSVAFTQKIKDQTAELDATGTIREPITQEEFVAQLGYDKGLQAYQNYQEGQRFAADRRSTANNSPAENDALLAKYNPDFAKPGAATTAGERDSLREAIDENRKKRDKAPAEYAMAASPAVQHAREGLNRTLSDPNAPMEARQAAARTFADTMLAEQARLGVAPEHRTIVSKTYVDALAARLQRPDTVEGGGAAVGAMIHAEAALWGEHWPQVYREVAKSAGAPFRVLGSGVTDKAAKALVDNLHLKEVDLLKNDLDPNTKLAQITSDVYDKFEKFKGTLVGSEREATLKDFRDAAVKLATIYHNQGDGDYAEHAFNDLIGFKYDFAPTYRVPKYIPGPKGEMQPAPFNKPQIDMGVAAAAAGLGTGNLAIAPPADKGEGYTADYRMRAKLATLRRGGVWVTDPRENGLMLTYDNQAVRGANGRPVMLTWGQLAAMGQDQERESIATPVGVMP